MSNWKPIVKAPRGIGPVLLRLGSGPLDPAFVGQQLDDGCWVTGDAQIEVAPRFFALIHPFDCDEDS